MQGSGALKKWLSRSSHGDNRATQKNHRFTAPPYTCNGPRAHGLMGPGRGPSSFKGKTISENNTQKQKHSGPQNKYKNRSFLAPILGKLDPENWASPGPPAKSLGPGRDRVGKGKAQAGTRPWAQAGKAPGSRGYTCAQNPCSPWTLSWLLRICISNFI